MSPNRNFKVRETAPAPSSASEGPSTDLSELGLKAACAIKKGLFNEKPNADYSGDLISQLRTGNQTLTIFDITLVAPDGANPHPVSCNDWFVIF